MSDGSEKRFTVLDEMRKLRTQNLNGSSGHAEILEQVRELEKQQLSVARAAPVASAKADDIERLTLLDPLTELYNYRTFIKELKAELSRARRYNHSISLCMLNIDELESVRSQYGDLMVEAVLKVVGNVIQSSIREVDIAARYLDPIFAIVLPETTAASASMVAERVRQRIANQVISHNWQNFSVTCSLGVACYPQQASAHDELIARALEAMQLAVERGGDRVFSP